MMYINNGRVIFIIQRIGFPIQKNAAFSAVNIMDWAKWFEERANKYDTDYQRVAYTSEKSMISRFKICLSTIKIKENMNILDIGSGTGNFLESVEKEFSNVNVIGIDIAINMLIISRQKDTNADFIKADVLKLPLKDGSMDCITCMEVLSNFNGSEEMALREIVRVLAPNGQVFLTAIDKNYSGNHIYEESPDDEARLNQKLYVPEELGDVLRSMDIKNVRISSFSSVEGIPVPLHQWDKFFIYGIK